MPLKIEEVELGKSYQLQNGTIRKVFEIVPENPANFNGACDRDIIRYEAEKWSYDVGRFGGKTRVKVKVREKMKRCDFANEATKRID
jgi:hypothetical protein